MPGHGAVVSGEPVDRAFDMLGRMAGAARPAFPDEAVLDLLLHTMEGG